MSHISHIIENNGRLSRTEEWINIGRQWGIMENNGGLSPGRLTVEVSRSLGIISVDYLGRRGDYQSALGICWPLTAPMARWLRQIRSAGIASVRLSDKSLCSLGMIFLSDYHRRPAVGFVWNSKTERSGMAIMSIYRSLRSSVNSHCCMYSRQVCVSDSWVGQLWAWLAQNIIKDGFEQGDGNLDLYSK